MSAEGRRRVEALAREVGRFGVLLHGLRKDDWQIVTRCPPLTVLQLSAHVYRGATRIPELLASVTDEHEPEKDAVTYFQYDAVAEAPTIARRAQDVAAEFADPGAFLKAWDEAWIRGLRDARGSVEADPVGGTVFGLMRLTEYLCTRILEVTVHHMDVRDALGRSPDPDPTALEITGDILRGLLGTDLRGTRMDDVRFVLVGTGRAQLDDAERSFLGPLAEKFPLLS